MVYTWFTHGLHTILKRIVVVHACVMVLVRVRCVVHACVMCLCVAHACVIVLSVHACGIVRPHAVGCPSRPNRSMRNVR
jgi:hypothetical protein